MKLVIALDTPSKAENLALVESLRDFADQLWLKVGLRAFVRDGADFLREVRKLGAFKIFLDLKLYDIPNTMLGAIEEIQNLGVDMLTIHASSGAETMREIAEKFPKASRPKILAVTALTSFTDFAFDRIYNAPLDSAALKMARLTFESGLDGVVCSCFETQKIKNSTSKDFIALTPGIRPFDNLKGGSADDQQRAADLQMAKEVGSDFIVVGRPIYNAPNPREMVEKILKNI